MQVLTGCSVPRSGDGGISSWRSDAQTLECGRDRSGHAALERHRSSPPLHAAIAAVNDSNLKYFPTFELGGVDLPFDITRRPLALAAESPFSSDSRRQTAAHIPRPCTQRSHPAARSPREASREL